MWHKMDSTAPFNLIKLPTDITEDQVKGTEEGSAKRDPLYRMLTAMIRFHAVEYNNTSAIQLIAGSSIYYDFPMEGRPEYVTVKTIDTLLPARITNFNINDEKEYEEFQKRAGRMVCDDKCTTMMRKQKVIVNNEAESKSKKSRKRKLYDNDVCTRETLSSSDPDMLYNKKSGIPADDDYGSMDVSDTYERPLVGKKTIRISDNRELLSDYTDSDY